jgi:hypothetical protein
MEHGPVTCVIVPRLCLAREKQKRPLALLLSRSGTQYMANAVS